MKPNFITKKGEYEKLLEEYRQAVKSAYPESTGFAWDGPINSELWFNNQIPVKMLFLLKETYGTTEEITQILDNPTRNNDSKTNKKISLLAYSLQHVFRSQGFLEQNISNQTLFDEIDKVHDSKPTYGSIAYQTAFSKIAVLEIKKTAGGTQSNDYEIREHGRRFADLLTRQIELLQPDIIFCGGSVTWKVLTEYITPFKQQLNTSNDSIIHTINDIVIVNAYHPSYNGIHWYDQVFDLADYYNKELEKRRQQKDISIDAKTFD